MTNRYVDTKCIVCSEVFAEGDDIVVCPECGTPYHRDCWNKEGRCVNTELHERGFSWQPVYENAESEQTEDIPHRCPRCGAQAEEGQLFCSECGMPLMQPNGESAPFNNMYAPPHANDSFSNAANGGTNAFNNYDMPNSQAGPNGFGAGMTVRQIKLTEESDIDGIRLGDLLEFAGRRSVSIVGSFIKFAKMRMKTSINIPALLFPELYFFYRKMTKEGIFFMLCAFLLSIPQLIYFGQSGDLGMVLFNTGIDLSSRTFMNVVSICSFANSILSIIAGLFANYRYYQLARASILKIRADETLDEDEIRQRIRMSGGTSWARVIVAATASMMLTLVFWFILGAKFTSG